MGQDKPYIDELKRLIDVIEGRREAPPELTLRVAAANTIIDLCYSNIDDSVFLEVVFSPDASLEVYSCVWEYDAKEDGYKYTGGIEAGPTLDAYLKWLALYSDDTEAFGRVREYILSKVRDNDTH